MGVDEQLFKPIVEATYLTVNNAWRYRAILRYCFLQHERLRHYLLLEEIWQHLKSIPQFSGYTEEMLQQDLDQLVAWRNLTPRQDTGRVSSIEEFKRRKYRYQLTPYSIEIERMVRGLENLGDGFGGSLERTLFDRLLEGLLRLTARTDGDPDSTSQGTLPGPGTSAAGNKSRGTKRSKDPGLTQSPSYKVFGWPGEELNQLWQDVYQDFRKLTENATDYLAHLQSEKVEEKMLTEAFLVYKEAITEYLRNFMASLQRTSFRIEGILQAVGAGFAAQLAGHLADYELSIPRLEERPEREQLVAKYRSQWDSLQTWFLGEGAGESDLVYLQNATNETIRRLTRFAQRLGESHHQVRSRRADYLHLAKWFAGLAALEEAHKLSACVFGVFHTRHLHVECPKQTDSYEVEVWDEPAAVMVIRPKVRAYHERTKAGAAIDHAEEKQAAREAYLREKAAELELVAAVLGGDRIVVSALPVVSPFMRKTLLGWISKGMSDPARRGKTETGRSFTLHLASNRAVRLYADDGVLELPDFVLQFDDAVEAAR